MAKSYKTGIIITGDASGAVKASQLTGKELDALNRKGKQVSSQLSDIAAKGVKWGAAAAGAAAAGAAVLIKRQLDLIDNTAKTSDKLGIATEKLTAMRVQAELTGVAQGTLDKGLQQMIKGVGDAAEGTGVAADALAKLNLNAEDLKKLSPDQQFYAIADAMEEVKSNTDKVSIAYDIFGGKGTALINTLKGGSAAALEAQKFTDQWGLAINRVDSSKIEQANDAMTLLGQASQGFWRQLTVNVSPAITGMAKEVLGFGEGFGTAGEMADKAFNAIVTGGALVADMGRVLQIVWKGATAIVAQWFAGVWDAIAGADRLLTGLLNKLPEAMGGGSFKTSDFLQNVSGALRNTATELSEELTDLLERPLASTTWPQKIKEWEKSATEAGQKVAESAKVVTGDYEAAASATKLLTAAEQKRRDEAEKLAAQRAELLGDTEYQVDLLSRELAAMHSGEKALAAFNREKAIEAALRGESAQKLLPDELEKYKAMVGVQYDLAVAIGKKAEADRAAADELKRQQDQAGSFADSWVSAWERIDSAGADAWMSIGDSFEDTRDSILDSFKRMLAEMAHMAVTKPIMIEVQAVLSGGAASGGLSASGGLGGIAKLIGGLGRGASGYSAMAGGGTSVLAGGSAAPSALMSGIYSAGFGAAVAYGANSFVTALSDITSGNGNGFDVLDVVFPGIGSAANSIKNAISGSGTSIKNYGVELGVGGGDLSGRNYINKKKDRGVLKSTKHWTAYSDLDSSFAESLVAQFDAVMGGVVGMFDTLGAGVTNELIAGFESSVSKISFSGKSDEEIEKALSDWFDGVAIDLSGYISGQLGDTFADFELLELVKLSSALSSANNVLDAMNGVLFESSISGAEAADALIKMAGGADAFIFSSGKFFDLFYSDADKFAASAVGVNRLFNDLNVVLPNSREELKELVVELDRTSQSGRAAHAALTAASDLLDDYYSKLEDYTKSAYDFDAVFGLNDGRKELRDALAAVGHNLDIVETAAQGGVAALASLFVGLSDVQKAGLEPFTDAILALSPALKSASAIASERANLEVQLLQLLGDTDELRRRERSALDASNRSLYDQINAIRDQQAANEELARSLEQLRSVSEGISSYLQGLEVSQFAGTPEQQAINAIDQFRSLSAAALGGDIDAARSLTSAADSVLNLSKDAYASGAQFQSLYDEVKSTLSSVVSSINIESYEQAQLRLMQEQIDAIVDVENSAVDNSLDEVSAVNALQSLLSAVQDNGANNLIYLGAINANILASYGRLNTLTSRIESSYSAGALIVTSKNQSGDNLAKFAGGGYVSGAGTGTSDSINAMLSNGEYVVKAAAVKSLGVGFLDNINSGSVPVAPVGMPRLANSSAEIVAELQTLRKDLNTLMAQQSADVNHQARIGAAGSKQSVDQLKSLNSKVATLEAELKLIRMGV